MRIGFSLGGVDVTIIDTTIPDLQRNPDMERLDELIGKDELTDEEALEYGAIYDRIAPQLPEE